MTRMPRTYQRARRVRRPGAVQARAAVLVADTKRAEGVPKRAAGLKLSAFANGGGFSDVRVDVRVGISDAPDQSFDDPQQREVNLDGVWYRACTAQSNRRTARDRLDRTGSGCPGSNGRSDVRNNAAVIHVDRRARTRTVRVLWNVQADPGLVFLPDRRSEPVVSAGRIATSVVAAIDVEPAGFGGILELLQARVVGLLSAAGGLGLVFFFVLLYLLFKVKDVGDWLVGHAMRKVHGRVRAARSARGAITTTAPAPPVPALPPSNEVPLSE